MKTLGKGPPEAGGEARFLPGMEGPPESTACQAPTGESVHGLPGCRTRCELKGLPLLIPPLQTGLVIRVDGLIGSTARPHLVPESLPPNLHLNGPFLQL